ncbi:MAG TPA: hypothetical protein VG015_10040, partial [Candidatus Dormibacteraeota bacterium]|nr:hypothetical protein [Candidatus Dormibacteraeota bacterium]
MTFGGLIRRSTVGLVMVGLWLHLGANASLAGASPSLAASFRPVFPGQTSYVTSAIQASQTAATANDLTYRGGLVQQNPSVYVVFWHWQGQDPAGEEPYLEGFLQGMGGSAWLNTVTQYCQAIAVGSSVCDGAGQAAGNPKAIFKGTWHDDQNWVGGSPSYSDVQSEVALAAVHFGLSRDPALESNYQVLVAFPHGTAIPEQNICGMHETVAGGAFEGLPYVEMPYLPDMGQSCGRNFVNLGEAGLLDGVGIVAGHEIAETITDPYPPDGWYTDNGEIGDLCAWLRSGPGAVADVSLSTGTFAVQGLWSNSVANGSGGCTTSYLGNAPLSSPSAQVSPTPSPVSTSGPSKATTFYFTEGYTGPGFQEKLNLLMPLTSGVATVTYYTAGGQLQTAVPLVAGVPVAVDVNAAVGPWQNVSARVDFPAPGVAERRLTFASGLWKGTTDEVGVTSPSSHWDFAEGSTLGGFSEFLTILNPDPQPVVATLNYFTDQGAHPTKTVALPASSRTTVEVFRGSLADQANCDPLAGTCGVGRDISGVSARVTTPAGRPVVVERPVYLNNQDFGSGQISDGHDTFGAGSASQAWYFAEGTTLPGFNEFLTIENPGSVTAKVQITYQESGSVLARSLVVPPLSRSTVEVF